MEAKHSPEAKRQMMVLMQAGTSGQGRPACIRGITCLLASRRLPILTPTYNWLMHFCGEPPGNLVRTCYTFPIKLEKESQGNANDPPTAIA